MIAERPEFASPIILIDGFLPEEEAAQCLEHAIALRPVFMPARVGAGSQNAQNRDIRSNEVVYLDDVFRAARDRSPILTLLHKAIHSPETNSIWHQGDLIFDAINYATWHEMVLSRYGSSEFYLKHQDTVKNPEHPEHITRRLVSACYYMAKEPQGFSGGELVLHKNGEQFVVRPRHNLLVVFPSFTHHEVKGVKLIGTDWESARFSVNIWIGFKG